MKEQFCTEKDRIMLNMGVGFLCLIASNTFYKRFQRKQEKSSRLKEAFNKEN